MTGGIVWLTGLSGAGKSTLSTALFARLSGRRPVELLDGDDVRTFLSAGLGFSRADRDTNVHRIAYVGRLLARHGVLVLVAAISPYAATRAQLRARSEAAGHPFVETNPTGTMANGRSASRLPFDGNDTNDGAADVMVITTQTPRALNAP